MSRDYIRLSLTDEVKDTLNELREVYSPLNDGEILKLGLAKLSRRTDSVDKLEDIARRGRKHFANWLKVNKGLNIDDLTEEEVYEIIKNA